MTEPIAKLHPALAYAARGWHVFPVAPHAKTPLTAHGFKDATTDAGKIGAWLAQWPNCNWGIATGPSGLLVVDVDPKSGGDQAWAKLVEKHGEQLVDSVRARTQGDGLHVYFKRPPANGHGDLGITAGHIAAGIDTRGDGGYVVAPPSIGPTGKAYAWATGHGPDDVDVKPLPQVLFDLLKKPKTALAIAPAVQESIVAGGRNAALASLAGSMQRRGMAPEAILAALQQQNLVACKPPLPLREVETIVRSIARYEKGPLPNVLLDEGEHDVGNGKRLAALYSHMFRFVHEWGWMVWDGRVWARDTRGRMEAWAKKTVDALEAAIPNVDNEEKAKALRKWARTSRNKGRIEAMIAMARSEPSVDQFREQFDMHDHLLNVRNGVIDLRTGELLPHDPELYMTGFVDIEYDAAALAPRWQQFLKETCLSNEDLMGYLQRAAGYTLTGFTSEHVLFFLFGDGRNGKSTFITVLGWLLGDMAEPLSFDSLLQSRESRAENTLASLVGKRLASATEPPEGRAFNEEMIKSMTGSDMLRARHMYMDGFGFLPKFKLWLGGNDKPLIRGVNEGIWERFHLVPFQNHVERHKRNKQLDRQLREELPGILAWAVRGAVEWSSKGLQPPAIVSQAVDEYRGENDVIGRFIEECCTVRPDLSTPAGELHKAINAWAEEHKERSLSANMLGRRLAKYRAGLLQREKGEKEHSGLVIWKGIGLGRNAPLAGNQARIDAAPIPRTDMVQGDRLDGLLEVVKRLWFANTEDRVRRVVRMPELVAELGPHGWREDDLQRDLKQLAHDGRLICRLGAGTWAPFFGGQHG